MEVNPGYKQTEVGVIPEDWETADLASITDPNRPISYGIVQTGPNVAGGVRCLRVLDIEAGRINRADLITTSKRISASYKRTILVANDLVMPLRGKVGDVGMIDKDLVGFNLTRGVALIAIRPESSPRYCKQAISSSASRSRLEQSMNGSALQEIPIGMLRRFKLALPATRTEQENIAEALGDADALIESLEQLLTKKRQIKKGAMQELLTGRTRLPGFSGEWRTVRSGDLGRFQGGNGFPTKFQGATTGDYPFFKVSDMNNKGNETFMARGNNYISEKVRKQLGARAFPTNSIVFAKVGAAVFLERKRILAERSCLDNNMAAFVLSNDAADYRFLHYVLVDTNLGDLVSTTALPSLSGSVLAAIVFRVPPIAEQTAIATLLSDMDAEITALEAKLSKARQIKQGMMQELLTGRIRLE